MAAEPTSWAVDHWSAPWMAEPKSPRKSPRRRRPRDGLEGNGRPSVQEAPVVPDAKRLPKPPLQVVPAGPKTGASASSGTPSAERVALDQLLETMRAQQDDLTPQLRQLLAQHGKESTEAEAKSLHKLVATQNRCKKELLKIRVAKTAYAQKWAKYISQVSDTIRQQMEQHLQTVANFESKEAQWEQALAEAAQELHSQTKKQSWCCGLDRRVGHRCYGYRSHSSRAGHAGSCCQTDGRDCCVVSSAAASQGASGCTAGGNAAGAHAEATKCGRGWGCAPSIGPTTSRTGLMGQRTPGVHSVTRERDYVGPLAAVWYALQLRAEIDFNDIALNTCAPLGVMVELTFQSDPRLHDESESDHLMTCRVWSDSDLKVGTSVGSTGGMLDSFTFFEPRLATPAPLVEQPGEYRCKFRSALRSRMIQREGQQLGLCGKNPGRKPHHLAKFYTPRPKDSLGKGVSGKTKDAPDAESFKSKSGTLFKDIDASRQCHDIACAVKMRMLPALSPTLGCEWHSGNNEISASQCLPVGGDVSGQFNLGGGGNDPSLPAQHASSCPPRSPAAAPRDGIDGDSSESMKGNADAVDSEGHPQEPTIIVLEKALPPQLGIDRRVQFAVDQSMLDELVAEFALEKLAIHVPHGCRLHPAASRLLRHSRCVQKHDDVSNAVVFVDGSFSQQMDTCSWAIAAFDARPGETVWLGYMAGYVPSLACEGKASAFRAELFAQLMAHLLVAALPCCRATIAYDATSAAQVACGDCTTDDGDTLARQLASAGVLVRNQGKTLKQIHVQSHTGNPGNELVDCLANAVIEHEADICAPSDSCYAVILEEHVLDWLRLFPRGANNPQLPPVAEDGAFVARAICRDVGQCGASPASLRPSSCPFHANNAQSDHIVVQH